MDHFDENENWHLVMKEIFYEVAKKKQNNPKKEIDTEDLMEIDLSYETIDEE